MFWIVKIRYCCEQEHVLQCTHTHTHTHTHRLQYLKRCLLFPSVSQLCSPSCTSQHHGQLNYTRHQGRRQWAGPRGRKAPLPLLLMILVSLLGTLGSPPRVSKLHCTPCTVLVVTYILQISPCFSLSLQLLRLGLLIDVFGGPPPAPAPSAAAGVTTPPTAVGLSPGAEEGFMRFLLKNNGVLFENEMLQVGVKSEYKKNLGQSLSLPQLSLSPSSTQSHTHTLSLRMYVYTHTLCIYTHIYTHTHRSYWSVFRQQIYYQSKKLFFKCLPSWVA